MSHTRLFVGNVPESANENDLQQAFSSFGQIISVDLKTKSNSESDQKKFAFITLSGSHYDIESCIKHFSGEDFAGSRLYVTRARESFLERLQRERNEAQKKETEKHKNTEKLPKKTPVLKLGDKLNPRKRKFDHQPDENDKIEKVIKPYEKKIQTNTDYQHGDKHDKKQPAMLETDKKKSNSDQKRMESMKRKRQEFKEKQMIIKSGLVGVDKVANKKIIFTDDEGKTEHKLTNGFKNQVSSKSLSTKNSLFEDDESDDEVNFEIKKQFEGKKGQKVLDLQSRYKSDKRFVLDERFIEDDQSEHEGEDEKADDNERVDLEEADEKTKQLNILQDVLGVAIKTKAPPKESDTRKTKSKLGMLRFDPSQPEHAKFLAPVEESKEEQTKKSKKKKKDKQQEEQDREKHEPEVEKVEVSKEQFYKVSETLKETLEQPSSFSLRSLFGQSEDNTVTAAAAQDASYIPLKKSKGPKVKNPLEPNEKNPFVYDSSESEDEEPEPEIKKSESETQEVPVETKAVWKENLFFSKLDNRLLEGLAFFNKSTDSELHKERRELKSVMKKRIYNKERKNQMFQKKIGGKKKSMKKSYRKKS